MELNSALVLQTEILLIVIHRSCYMFLLLMLGKTTFDVVDIVVVTC